MGAGCGRRAHDAGDRVPRRGAAESLLQEYGDFLAGLGLPEDLAEGCPQRQPVGPLAGGHESGREGVTVDRADDLDGTPRAEEIIGAREFEVGRERAVLLDRGGERSVKRPGAPHCGGSS